MDNQKKHTLGRTELSFFFFLGIVIFIFSYFFYGQLTHVSERTYNLSDYEVLDDWTITYPDGSSSKISLPTDNSIMSNGQTVTICNTLPKVSGYNCISYFSRGQNVEVYINEDLRYSFTEKNMDGIGPDRPYLTLFYKYDRGDLGKEIKLVISSTEYSSANILSAVYVGSETSLVYKALSVTLFELIMGVFLLLVGIIISILCTILQTKLQTHIPLVHLGIGVSLCSLWLICNSTGRQFIVSNVSMVRNVSFLLVPLMPIPFTFYFDAIQKKRYTILFTCLRLFCIADFITVLILNNLNIIGLTRTFIFSVINIILLATIIIYTFIQDFFIKKIDNFYTLSAISTIIFGIFAITQIVIFILNLSDIFNGLFLGIGIIFIVVLSSIETSKNYNDLYFRHKNAMNQMKLLSRESIITIAKTVDAKDPYTHEHSERVSEYSGALARTLGWDNESVEELEHAALLHDIGKIGIPDAVLNKPSKLTDEEYNIIKSHTTIGAEILQNITSTNYAYEVALYHHERYDGKGYPTGLAGEAIPECARIVCIADSFDAMNSRRVYRNKLNRQDILDELQRNRGLQFDPLMLDAFMTIVNELMDKNNG